MKNNRITLSGWFMSIPVFCVGLAASSAQALTTGTYVLHNHPDGAAAQPYYGLRLDGLMTDGIYTFDFDAGVQGAAMFLTYTQDAIRIHGQAWGGRDTGTQYEAPTLWNIEFTYRNGMQVMANGGQDDVRVAAGSAGNGGTISSIHGQWNLVDFAGPHEYSFQLGDMGGAGHRGFDGMSGWGWINYFLEGGDPDHHAYSSDWLFTMEPQPVPVPAAAWLFGSGLMGLTLMRRRGKV